MPKAKIGGKGDDWWKVGVSGVTGEGRGKPRGHDQLRLFDGERYLASKDMRDMNENGFVF